LINSITRLAHRLLVHLVGAEKQRIAIDIPTQRRVRNLQISEDVFVESILAEQQFMQPGEKSSRFSALNDAMIVGAANRDCFADAKLRQNRGVDRLIFGRELNSAGGDDR
jgi:hypothetical protein